MSFFRGLNRKKISLLLLLSVTVLILLTLSSSYTDIREAQNLLYQRQERISLFTTPAIVFQEQNHTSDTRTLESESDTRTPESESDSESVSESYQEDKLTLHTSPADEPTTQSVQDYLNFYSTSSSKPPNSTASVQVITKETTQKDMLNSGTEQNVKFKEVKTADIPYDTFLLPTNSSVVFRSLLGKHNDVYMFLKYMQYEKFVPQTAKFGNPDKMGCDENYCYINGRTIRREVIRENPGDMFKILPAEHEYLKQFKNPCWKGKLTSQSEKHSLFCTPYFFIIGFTKSGTTDMFNLLQQHPLISSLTVKKEPHFYDRLRRGRIFRMNRRPVVDQPPISFTYFLYKNRRYNMNNFIKTFKEVPGSDVLFHGITMDASPSTVWDNEYWELFHPRHTEPPVTNADTIFNINPKTKITFSMRDPVKRMLSAYQFFCKRNVYNCSKPITPEKYHDLVVEAVGMFNKCLKSNSVRGCTYSTKTHQLATHLYASMYNVYVADYMKIFPRNQLYFIKMEEHIGDLNTSLNNLCDFLDVPRFPAETLQQFQDRDKVKNQLRVEDKLPYVLNKTTEILEEFFKPYIGELVNLLGDDKWYWGRPH